MRPSADRRRHRALDGCDIPTLARGSSLHQTISDGGMMGVRVLADGVMSVNTTAVHLSKIKNRTSTPIASGASVDAPAWVVATYPRLGSATLRLSYT